MRSALRVFRRGVHGSHVFHIPHTSSYRLSASKTLATLFHLIRATCTRTIYCTRGHLANQGLTSSRLYTLHPPQYFGVPEPLLHCVAFIRDFVFPVSGTHHPSILPFIVEQISVFYRLVRNTCSIHRVEVSVCWEVVVVHRPVHVHHSTIRTLNTRIATTAAAYSRGANFSMALFTVRYNWHFPFGCGGVDLLISFSIQR